MIDDEEVSKSITVIGKGASAAAAKANAHAELQALIQKLYEESETPFTVSIDSEGFVWPY